MIILILRYVKIREDFSSTLDPNFTLIFLKVYSDFIIEKQPITVEDVEEIYEKMSKYVGTMDSNYEQSSPLTAKLVPIDLVRKLEVILIS